MLLLAMEIPAPIALGMTKSRYVVMSSRVYQAMMRSAAVANTERNGMADQQSNPKPPLRRGWLKEKISIHGWGELVMWGGLCAPLATLGRVLTTAYLPGWGWRVGAYLLAGLLAAALFSYAGIKEDRLAKLIFMVMPVGIVWFIIVAFTLLGNVGEWLSERLAPGASSWLPLLIMLLPMVALISGLPRGTSIRLTEQVDPATIAAASQGGLAELKPHLRPGDEIWAWETPK